MKLATNHLVLPRSPLWPQLRNKWLHDHPNCAACGSNKNVEVHHKVPVHVARSLELDPANLITLCESKTDKSHECHLRLGHLGNWFNWNRNIDKQASDELLRMYPKDGHYPKQNPPNTTHALPLPVAPLANPAANSPADPPDPDSKIKPFLPYRRLHRRK